MVRTAAGNLPWPEVSRKSRRHMNAASRRSRSTTQGTALVVPPARPRVKPPPAPYRSLRTENLIKLNPQRPGGMIGDPDGAQERGRPRRGISRRIPAPRATPSDEFDARIGLFADAPVCKLLRRRRRPRKDHPLSLRRASSPRHRRRPRLPDPLRRSRRRPCRPSRNPWTSPGSHGSASRRRRTAGRRARRSSSLRDARRQSVFFDTAVCVLHTAASASSLPNASPRSTG